ncbi:MAG: ricin-type beta-trefoil lectin domain protein [Myxococcaceae bacterium]
MKLALILSLLFCGHSSSFNIPNKTRENFSALRYLTPNFDKHSFLIYNLHSRKCLDVLNGSLLLNDCQLKNIAEFELVRVQGSIYQIKHHLENRCLEIQNASTANGARLELNTCSDSPHQEALLQDSNTDEIYKKIVFIHSGKCLDSENLTQWTCNPWPSQDFLISERKVEVSQLPKIVWTYWDTGFENMPAFYKSNVDHWKKILGQEWSIRVLNLIEDKDSYFGNYLPKEEIPSISLIKSKIGDRDFEQKLNPTVIESDFIRLELLAKYGGVWMDPSIMLHRNFSDIQTPLEALDDFEILGFTSRSQANTELRYTDSLENFFLAVLPNSEIMEDWKDNFKKYWIAKQPGMAIEDHPMYNGNQGNEVDTSQYGQFSNYLNQHVALKYTLINNQEFARRIFIFADTLLQEKGPFSLLQMVNWKDSELLSLKKSSIERFLENMKDVLMSKFPSSNSKDIRQQTEAYFTKENNIFGRLNKASQKAIHTPLSSCPDLDIADDSYTLPSETGFSIKTLDGESCLTIRSKNDGGTLQMQKCTGQNNQLFEEILLANSKIVVRSLFSCKCLDIEGQSFKPTTIHQWHCHAGTSQQLQRIQNMTLFTHSGKCLDVEYLVMQQNCITDKLSQQLQFQSVYNEKF